MKHASMKTRDDVLTTDPAAAFAKFRGAMGKLVALPRRRRYPARKQSVNLPRNVVRCPPMRRPAGRLFTLCSAASLPIVLFTLDLGLRDGTIVVHLKWYHPPLLVWPVAWVLRESGRRAREEQRAERRRAGLCADCGYDLRATSGRCPEMFSLL